VRHPHVVDVLDVGVDEGIRYLVMELVEGPTFAKLLRREAPLSLAAEPKATELADAATRPSGATTCRAK
jgi:serine/threonine protein kinase